MTAIEWTHRPGTVGRSWNPVTGCQKVSEGCRHCYAETVANRFWATQYPTVLGDGSRPETIPDQTAANFAANGLTRPRRFTDVWTHPDRLAAPLAWRKPATVFVNSTSDLFHEDVPNAFIDQVFAVMALCPQHTFIVLSKRPIRMLSYCSRGGFAAQIGDVLKRVNLPLPNVWLGVSVEDQATADQRIPLLLQMPAAIRFVSAEPLLGPISFRWAKWQPWNTEPGGVTNEHDGLRRLDWLIVGGESGPQARPADVAWIRSLKDQAAAARVPCFVKQLGAYPRVEPGRLRHWEWGGEIGQADREGRFTADGAHWRLHLKNRKGGDPAEWPVDLRVREWPDARAGEAREVGRVR